MLSVWDTELRCRICGHGQMYMPRCRLQQLWGVSHVKKSISWPSCALMGKVIWPEHGRLHELHLCSSVTQTLVSWFLDDVRLRLVGACPCEGLWSICALSGSTDVSGLLACNSPQVSTCMPTLLGDFLSDMHAPEWQAIPTSIGR